MTTIKDFVKKLDDKPIKKMLNGVWIESDEEKKDLYERNSDTIQSFIFNEIDTEDDINGKNSLSA